MHKKILAIFFIVHFFSVSSYAQHSKIGNSESMMLELDSYFHSYDSFKADQTFKALTKYLQIKPSENIKNAALRDLYTQRSIIYDRMVKYAYYDKSKHDGRYINIQTQSYCLLDTTYNELEVYPKTPKINIAVDAPCEIFVENIKIGTAYNDSLHVLSGTMKRAIYNIKAVAKDDASKIVIKQVDLSPYQNIEKNGIVNINLSIKNSPSLNPWFVKEVEERAKKQLVDFLQEAQYNGFEVRLNINTNRGLYQTTLYPGISGVDDYVIVNFDGNIYFDPNSKIETVLGSFWTSSMPPAHNNYIRNNPEVKSTVIGDTYYSKGWE